MAEVPMRIPELWASFAAATLSYGRDAGSAARFADSMLDEFCKRFEWDRDQKQWYGKPDQVEPPQFRLVPFHVSSPIFYEYKGGEVLKPSEFDLTSGPVRQIEVGYLKPGESREVTIAGKQWIVKRQEREGA